MSEVQILSPRPFNSSSGGIGIHVVFRCRCRKAWGFKSLLEHHFLFVPLNNGSSRDFDSCSRGSNPLGTTKISRTLSSIGQSRSLIISRLWVQVPQGPPHLWKVGRVADYTGLENRRGCNSFGSSNLSPSAIVTFLCRH